MATGIEMAIDRIETWNSPKFQNGRRVLRVHSDRGTEFVNRTLASALRSRNILHTTTRGYTPQANGTAEAAVKQCKRVIRRLLTHAGLGEPWWGYAALHACEVMQSHWEGKQWKYPAFGETVVARTVSTAHHRFEERGCLGRLLAFRVHGDKSSDILIVAEGQEPEVIRCGAPALVTDTLSAPGVLQRRESDPRAVSDLRAKVGEKWIEVTGPHGQVLWVDMDTRRMQLTPPYVVEGESASELQLSSADDPIAAATNALMASAWGPHYSAKNTSKAFEAVAAAASAGQGRVHLTLLSEAWSQVMGGGERGPAKAIVLDLRSVAFTTGEERQAWSKSLAKELTSLKANRTYEVLKMRLKDLPKGMTTVPAKCVLTLKPDLDSESALKAKRKSRITVCGNFLPQVHESSTTNLDTNVMRLSISIAVQRGWTFSTLDVSTAFLNAMLPTTRQVYVRPPHICQEFGLTAPDEIWLLRKALYGLKESPLLWERERDKGLASLRFTDAHGETVRLQRSIMHACAWLLVKGEESEHRYAASLDLTSTDPDLSNLTANKVIGVVLVYVDDFLILMEQECRSLFLETFRAQWVTTEPVQLGCDGLTSLRFLGVEIEIPDHVWDQHEAAGVQGGPADLVAPPEVVLHQAQYVREMLERFPEGPTRSRASPGEAEANPVKGRQPVLPESNPQLHKRLQQIVGALLWVSTKTRPDISWALSILAASMARDLSEATNRARHLLQYLSSAPDYGLVYRRLPTELQSEYQVYTDISWAPLGERSQEASVQFVGAPGANLVAWHSTRQDLVALSTCESELIAATTGLSKSIPLQLMTQELSQSAVSLVLGVDNMPAIRQSRLGSESSFRTRHISIRGHRLSELVRSGKVDLRYTETKSQPADHLTKAMSGQSLASARQLLGLCPV